MVLLCSVSWTRNGSPLEGNCWAFHSYSLDVQLATLTLIHIPQMMCLGRLSAALLPVCAPSCRWGWSSRCEVSSGRPCWEVEGPRWFPGDSLWWSGCHPLIQCPLSQWLSEDGAHPVVEAELQGMVQTQLSHGPPHFVYLIPSPQSGLVTRGCSWRLLRL